MKYNVVRKEIRITSQEGRGLKPANKRIEMGALYYAPLMRALLEESMNLESQNLDDYLVSETIVDWKTPDVQQVAVDLTM